MSLLVRVVPLYGVDWEVNHRVGLQFGTDLAISTIHDPIGSVTFYNYGLPPRFAGNFFYDFGLYEDHVFMPIFVSLGLNLDMSLFSQAKAIDNNQELLLRWHEFGGAFMLKLNLMALFHVGVGVGFTSMHFYDVPTISSGFKSANSLQLEIIIQGGFVFPLELGDLSEDRVYSPLGLVLTLRGAFQPMVHDSVGRQMRLGVLVGLSWSFGEW